jgi:uncharacterized membrane protein YoaK (UPF0700 family)
VGGYADAAGFVLAKTFTGHITGNLVLAAVSAAARDWRTTLARVSAVAAFLAGIVLSVVLARLLPARQSSSLVPAALALEALLVIAAYLALTAQPRTGTEILVLCMALALGLQNGTFRREGGISVHTTYLTGMVTSLLVAEAERLDFLASQQASPPSPYPAGRTLWLIWVVFFCGALAGAAMVYLFNAPGILGALVILLVLLAVSSIAARPSRLAR